MPDLQELLDNLKKSEDALSESALVFRNAIGSTGDDKKDLKLVFNILHETLIKYKDETNASASSVILSCVHFLTSKWDDMRSSILQRFQSLLKVSLQRICSVDEDIALLTKIGWDVLKYLTLSKKGYDDGVAKWFLYGASQLTMKDTPCSCSSSSSCALTTAYIAEFQALFLKLLPHNGSYLSICGLLLTSFERHCCKKKFAKCHITSIVDHSFDILDKVSPMFDNPINCDASLRKAITLGIYFGGHASLHMKNTNTDLDQLSTALELIPKDLQSTGVDGLYLTLIDYSLAILTKNIDFCRSFTINALSFLRKLCRFVGYSALSNDQLLRLTSFLLKTCTEQTLELCLRFCHEISQKSNIIDGFHEGEDGLKFLGSVFSVGTMAVNGKSTPKLYELTKSLFQNLLMSLNRETFSENSKYVPIVANLGLVLAKIHRKNGKYFQSMKAAESTIKIIPYDSSMHLIDQWVKAKWSIERNVHCETLASNMKGNIPDEFLIKILIRELEMYVRLGMDASSIISVTTALLECDHTLLGGEISHILRHHIKAKFEIGGLVDFDELLDSNLDAKLLFEDVVEIRIVQFLQKWHAAMDNTDCRKTIFDFAELISISSHLKKAVDARYELKCISETCKAVHEACAITCVYGHYHLALQIIGSLYLLLQYQEDSVDTNDIIKLNICSALCEMTACYISLNQIATAQKYANQALAAWDSYQKCVDIKISEDDKTQQSKLLYFKVQATQVKILYLLHKADEAKGILKQCFEDGYLDMENVKTSVQALYCSCVVYMASFTELDSAELRMINLLDLLQRLSSLRMTILPDLHNGISTNNKSVDKTQRFGVRLQNMPVNLSMQLNCVSLLMLALRYISKTYILLGDPDLAKVYIYNGAAYAKCLHLKDGYLRFSLLKLELASIGDYAQYSDVVEHFCETAKCDCDKDKSWITINDDTLGDDREEYDISFNEADIDNEVLGSTDADAILIPTKKIKILDDKSYGVDISSTPKVRKRMILKKSKVLSFLSEKACSCASFCAVESSELRMELGVVHANFCLRNNNYEEALNICNFCLSVIAEGTAKSLNIDISSVCKNQFWWETRAELLIAKAAMLWATKNQAEAVEECESVKNLINESGLIRRTPSILRAKLHILFANFNKVQETMTEDACDIDQLNAFIDALSQPDETATQNTFKSPVLSRRRKILSAKSSTKTKTKSVKTQCKKAAVAGDKENFTIYEDNRRNNLPVPQFQIDRSPSPRPENVYDIDIQETQNIRITRKVARSRFKKQYGTTYTEEFKEKLRGRTSNKKSTAAKTHSGVTKLSSWKDPVFVDVDHASNLEDALVNASSVGDFILTKILTQALSQWHFRSYQTSGDNFQNMLAATYHLLSVGITTRSALNLYITKIRKRSSGKNLGVSWNIPNELSHDLFKNLVKKETSLISELQDLLPEKWTVCVISVTEATNNESKIFITRLRKHEIYHTQIHGGNFFEISQKFNQLMARNNEALKSCDKSYWWTQRRILDEELKSMISSLPSEVLGQYAGALLGSPMKNDAYELERSKLLEQFPFLRNDSAKLGVALDSWHYLTIQQKLSTVKGLIGKEPNKTVISLARAFEKVSTGLQIHLMERDHVILIPGKHLQLLPWESTPLLQKSSVTRMPSVDLLKHQLAKLKSSKHSVLNEGVDLNDVSYVLNPNGDLKGSEERIQERFQHMKTWKGIVARVPDNKEWICSITDFDLFIYCGHGSGDRYISGRDLQKVETRAAALLMGCNSAKLCQDGLFEPNGIVLNYLISGAPCVVGCLWRVTDKDIDKYLCKLLEKWADGKESPVSASAILAREGMKMPYINGAACVIYGLPIHCQASAVNVMNALPKI